MLRTQISVPSGQNLPKSEIMMAVLQQQIIVCMSHLFVFLAYLNWRLSVIKYIQP